MGTPLSDPGDHPVDRYAALATGLVRVDPPPRRVGPLQALRLVDADVPGRPLIRRITLALLAAILAFAVVAPDLYYARQPVVRADVVSSAPRDLPGPLAGVVDVLPPALVGHVATFRLPSGDVVAGPISEQEFLSIRDGAPSLEVYVMEDSGRHGRPVSGLFPIPRLVAAAALGLVALSLGLAALARLRRGWWMARLARSGIGVVGRPTEVKSQRLLRGEQPVGWRYDLFYDFRAAGGIREGVIRGFCSDRHVPFAADRPLRILYLPRKPERSLPLDLLPGVAHES
jgi:hypothetical protein